LQGFDAVFDTVGGDTYQKSFQILKQGGTIVSMVEPPHEDLARQYGVTPINQFTQVTSERLSKVAELLESGVLYIHVDKTFPLQQAGEALEYLREGKHRGKVVLAIKS
jgi:NADPH:quinone reductase-like Zn-dependent oxidoreductase